MSTFISRTATAAAILSLFAVGPVAAAGPKYKLVLIDGTSAVADVANHGWSVSSLLSTDQRCQREVCSPVPALPNDKGLSNTSAHAVNGLGHVVGASPAGDGTVDHAFFFDGSRSVDLGVFDNDGCGGCTLTSTASALNDRGQVVGASGDRTHYQAFLWQDGTLKNLGALGGTESSAFDINRHGHVVGFAETASGERHAFVYRHGRMRDLGTLPGDNYSDATGINDAGQIVGNSGGGETSRVFIHQDGVKTPVPMVPGARWAVATDINNHGFVVGLSSMSDFSTEGWVYDGTAAYRLNAVLVDNDWRYKVQGARGIADNGQIAVEVVDTQMHRNVGAILVPVK